MILLSVDSSNLNYINDREMPVTKHTVASRIWLPVYACVESCYESVRFEVVKGGVKM